MLAPKTIAEAITLRESTEQDLKQQLKDDDYPTARKFLVALSGTWYLLLVECSFHTLLCETDRYAYGLTSPKSQSTEQDRTPDFPPIVYFGIGIVGIFSLPGIPAIGTRV